MRVILQHLHIHVGILSIQHYFLYSISRPHINVDRHHRTSFPLRLGPLPSECYTTTSMRSHHRKSLPLRLEPLPSECYFMASTYKCRYTLHARVMFAKKISTAFKMSAQCRTSVLHRLGPLPSECYTWCL